MPSGRPENITYEVRGTFEFPEDMLRYDFADVADEAQRGIADDLFGGMRTVRIYGRRCTTNRWESFGWKVVSPEAPIDKRLLFMHYR